MTGYEVYDRALALLDMESGERGQFSEEVVLRQAQLTLSECRQADNALRRREKAEPIQEYDWAAMAAPLPCHSCIASQAMPYGLAAKLLFGQGDEMSRAAYLQALFQASLRALTILCPEEVVEVY